MLDAVVQTGFKPRQTPLLSRPKRGGASTNPYPPLITKQSLHRKLNVRQAFAGFAVRPYLRGRYKLLQTRKVKICGIFRGDRASRRMRVTSFGDVATATLHKSCIVLATVLICARMVSLQSVSLTFVFYMLSLFPYASLQSFPVFPSSSAAFLHGSISKDRIGVLFRSIRRGALDFQFPRVERI